VHVSGEAFAVLAGMADIRIGIQPELLSTLMRCPRSRAARLKRFRGSKSSWGATGADGVSRAARPCRSGNPPTAEVLDTRSILAKHRHDFGTWNSPFRSE